jgi:hypothetical protein
VLEIRKAGGAMLRGMGRLAMERELEVVNVEKDAFGIFDEDGVAVRRKNRRQLFQDRFHAKEKLPQVVHGRQGVRPHHVGKFHPPEAVGWGEKSPDQQHEDEARRRNPHLPLFHEDERLAKELHSDGRIVVISATGFHISFLVGCQRVFLTISFDLELPSLKRIEREEKRDRSMGSEAILKGE